MNTPIRRVALAVMFMVVALLANATYVQVFTAESLRTHPRNSRVLLDEYSRQRGQISAAGQVLATSVATDSRYKFMRVYPADPANPNSPEAYAHATGYYSLRYSSSALERTEDSILNGSDGQLFSSRLFDMIAGRDSRGGNVVTTLNPAAQQAAYDQLANNGYRGAVVALQPKTGEILAMASTPSFDPNLLSTHDSSVYNPAWQQLSTDSDNPLVNRATMATYPPGSTFKVVVTAAALEMGVTPDSVFTAAPSIQLPGSGASLTNYGGSNCGSGSTATLLVAFRLSCNTAFVQMGLNIGAEKLRQTATAFGIETGQWEVPLPVAESKLGELPDGAALGQSSIGQRDVALTTLQNAVIAATVANGGVRMEPHLVHQLQGPDLSVLSTTEPREVTRAISPEVARTLTQLMVASEQNSGGPLPGISIASKTGTAEHGVDAGSTPPHTLYIAFAPVEDPQVAVAVIVEDGGNNGLSATGSSVAAPVGRAVIRAALQGG